MEWFGFRFNYIVESNLEFAKQVFAEYGLDNSQYKILRRRTDALFPSFIKTVFIDARSSTMSIVDSEPLLNILQRTYNGKKGRNNNRDYNLAKTRLVILDRFIDASQWQDTCRKARSTSETLLRDRPDFIEMCQQSKTTAENKLEKRINQLRLRLGKLDDPVLAKELNIESALSQAILEGISCPNIRLDSVGFIVVSGQPPAQIGEDGDD
jgi:ATP-dependent helicase HepA